MPLFSRRIASTPGETVHICREILSCINVDSVSAHYSRRSQRYDVMNHFTALNQIALFDIHRTAHPAALPHLLVLERYIAPVLSELAPREIMTYAYISALYKRPTSVRHLALLEASLLRQLDVARAVGISPIWAEPRKGNESRLTGIPQASFSVIRGTQDLPQDVPNVLWAVTKTQLSAPALLQSIFDELLPFLLRAPQKPILTVESLLRTAWACARLGCADEVVVSALVDALEVACTAKPFSFSQRVLAAWALVTLNHEAHPFVRLLITHVFNHKVLEAAKPTLSLSAQQQIAQMHTLLTTRKQTAESPFRSSPSDIPVPNTLPAWLWRTSERHAAPIETDSHDSLTHGLSLTLKAMNIRHKRRYVVDGYTIDLAFPTLRFGLEIVNTRPLAIRDFRAKMATSEADESPPLISTSHHRMSEAKKNYMLAKGWKLVELDWSVWRHLDAAGRTKYISQLLPLH